MKVLKTLLNSQYIEDARHQELWEIPKIALREAVINAIVHTDYSLRGNSMTIAIFDDRIEIENSAFLPWGLTFEDLKAGVSKLRNTIIARVFNELGLIEQWGSGIKRMTNACLEADLEAPYFKETGPRIRVKFYKKKVSQLIMDDLDQFIFGLLTFCGPLSPYKITSCVGISRRSVINRLSGMVDKGQIVELSQSSNDPKKKYSLKETIWHDSIPHLGNLLVRLGIEKNCIDFVFSRNTIDDYFLDGGSSTLREQAKLVVKNIVGSDPIFGEVLLKVLSDEKVQEAFENRQIAKYHIQPKDFLERDYR